MKDADNSKLNNPKVSANRNLKLKVEGIGTGPVEKYT